MRNLYRIALYIIATILVIVILRFLYLEVNKLHYEKKVINYLLNEKGYISSDIHSVEGIYGVKLPKFYVIVTFINEPYVQYTYFAHNEVIQIDYEITDMFNLELKRVDLKNYDGLIDVNK